MVWILHENLYDLRKINSFYELDLAAENHFFLYQKNMINWQEAINLSFHTVPKKRQRTLILWFQGHPMNPFKQG
jgi:hypothetical protein